MSEAPLYTGQVEEREMRGGGGGKSESEKVCVEERKRASESK